MKGLLFFVCLALFATLIALSVIHFSAVSPTYPNSEEVRIDFLDIGQGDATLITFADGEQMLIDCSVDARILEALGRVMPFYDHSIDFLVVTHPDQDHYGGCVDVLDRFDVSETIVTGVSKNNDYYTVLVEALDRESAEHTRIVGPRVWFIASSTVSFLFPDRDMISETSGDHPLVSPNNSSIIIKIDHKSHTALLTGDAEIETEAYLVENFFDLLDIDILKAGHHGSDSSSSFEFLKATSPDHFIISVGADNSYGHPSERVMGRAARAGATVWRTDTQGDIMATLGDTVQVYEHASQ